MTKNDECVRFKNYDRKIKSPFIIHSDFEYILVTEDNGMKVKNSVIRTNIKYISLAVMAINWYVLIISLVSLLKYT